MAEAQREVALPRSGLGSQRGSQARGRVIGYPRTRLQDGKVAEVTELATVIRTVAVKQTGRCRRRGDDKERNDGHRGRQPEDKPDECSLQRHCISLALRSNKEKKRGQASVYHAHPPVSTGDCPRTGKSEIQSIAVGDVATLEDGHGMSRPYGPNCIRGASLARFSHQVARRSA